MEKASGGSTGHAVHQRMRWSGKVCSLLFSATRVVMTYYFVLSIRTVNGILVVQKFRGSLYKVG